MTSDARPYGKACFSQESSPRWLLTCIRVTFCNSRALPTHIARLSSRGPFVACGGLYCVPSRTYLNVPTTWANRNTSHSFLIHTALRVFGILCDLRTVLILFYQCCGKHEAYSVDYALRVRFCGECYKKKYVYIAASTTATTHNQP